MVANTFQKNIVKLDFSFKKGKDESGVLLTKAGQNQSALAPQEIFSLELAREKFDADAVYFRWFNDSREAVAQIYLYDFTAAPVTDERRKDIHRKVWSGCLVPIYIIIEKNQVKIFDARQNVEQSDDYAPELIKLTGKAISSFSASSFDDGLFWEEKEYKDDFLYSSSAYRDLISGLKNVYRDFQKRTLLDSHVALKLLVQCLLIKYLEERDEQSETGYFAATYFKRNFSCNNFCEVIRKQELLKLLDRLAEDFNGKIFDWDKKDEIAERKAIEMTDLSMLADYLDGHQDGQQFVLWRLYSFSHLPVELISSVYEELLTNSKDIVYTPEMVVSLLVDECMPLKNPQPDFKVIDVSCGSGIFLVKAYKRIIQWWRYQQWIDTGELKKPDLSTLKKLLKKSVYGIDIQQDAIRLSVFSLALALLDEVDLSPPVWQKLKFPDLSERNIVTADFFQYITDNYTSDFDLVIGNPPFNPPEIDGKKVGNVVYFQTLKTDYGYISEVKIPDDNPALHFLMQGFRLLKAGALLCMIQPTRPFLYQKNEAFRAFCLEKKNLLQVVDFTALSDILWGDKNVATVAAFFENKIADDAAVVHVIANRNNSNEKRLFFEFDSYDFHSVTKQEALANFLEWKSNLLGGGRVGNLIKRLSGITSLKDFLNEKKKAHGWVIGEGYTVGNRAFTAPHITGRKTVRPKDFTEDGIIAFSTEDETHFEAPRVENQLIFKGPHLVIKEVVTNNRLPIVFEDEDFTFTKGFVGIYAPVSERDELLKVYAGLQQNSNLNTFFIIATSSQFLITKASAILKKDIDNLPFSKEPIALSKAEQIVIEDVTEFYSKNFATITDTLATKASIKDYAQVFCQTLNTVYQDNANRFRLFKILDAGKYHALHFQYTAAVYQPTMEAVNELEQYIAAHVPQKKKDGAKYHVQRILKIYGKDTIIIAKPKNIRYWLRSIALRDADECFEDYFKAGF
jgi:SAM-dependent methyltransferase